MKRRNTKGTIELDKVMEKCAYPECGCEKITRSWHLPIEGSKTKIINLWFCEYHFLIVTGGAFSVKLLRGKKICIKGPLEEIRLIEQVMAAREMTKKSIRKRFK